MAAQGAERLVILLINDEFGTSKGGISTINLEAVQTLRGKAVKDKTVVYAIALRVPEQDQEAADRDGVTLITPYQKEGDKREPSLDWLTHDFKSHFPKSTLSSHEYQESRGPKSTLPPHVDVIVGHAHITDTAARNIHDEYYEKADLIMFTHVLPEDTEYFKGGERAMEASEKEKIMIEQVHDAKAAFSVGHRIFKHFKNKYRGAKKPREHHLFFPRPSKVFEEVDIEPDSGEDELVVLSVGRVKNAENLKGYNLTARAIGIVRKYLQYLRWITRGISKDDWEKSLKILEANLNSGDLKPTLRPYGTQEDIRDDMMMAHLVLMPSRSEPFGLVGLEAIAAGIPVLISDKSGLADMIKKLVAEKKLPKGLLTRIVETSMQDSDMDDTAGKWADKIHDTLKDTETAFKQAKEFKDELLKSKYWEDSEREFLQACGITVIGMSGKKSYVSSLEPRDRDRYLEKLLVSPAYAGKTCNPEVSGIRLPDPYSLTGWKDDLSLWPETDYGCIYTYLIEAPGPFNGEAMRAYKSLEAYNLFVSGHVREMRYHPIDNNIQVCYLKAAVMPGQRVTDSPHKPWVSLTKKEGYVVAAHCTCMAGFYLLVCFVFWVIWSYQHF